MIRRTGLILVSMLILASTGMAQPPRTSITLSGFTGTFASPTATDLDAGYVNASSDVTFTIANTRSTTARTAIVQIYSTTASLGGSKSASDFEWRLSTNPVTSFVGLSTVAASVGTYAVPTVVNNSVSANVVLRSKVAWTDPPASYTTGIVISLTVTIP